MVNVGKYTVRPMDGMGKCAKCEEMLDGFLFSTVFLSRCFQSHFNSGWFPKNWGVQKIECVL